MSQIHDRPSKNLKNQPRIRDRPMHIGQKSASDPGDINARGAETCLRFRAYLCTGCRNMPQIQGIIMHWGQKPTLDLGDIYARWAETRLRFRAYLCTVGRNVSQIQGRLMHGVQRRAPDFRQINGIPKWSVRNLWQCDAGLET